MHVVIVSGPHLEAEIHEQLDAIGTCSNRASPHQQSTPMTNTGINLTHALFHSAEMGVGREVVHHAGLDVLCGSGMHPHACVDWWQVTSW